jgi:hypothetical protein
MCRFYPPFTLALLTPAVHFRAVAAWGNDPLCVSPGSSTPCATLRGAFASISRRTDPFFYFIKIVVLGWVELDATRIRCGLEL